MNNFNTYVDFVGDKNIPNLDKDLVGFEANYNTPFQKEILIKLLGFDLYLAFEAGLLEGTIPAKWTDLKNGSTYILDGINYQNVGCKDLVAYYVYCKWLSANYEQITGIGVINSNSDNATNISPENKMTNAWNKMIKLYNNVYEFISENETDYLNLNTEELRLLTYGF
jgi:hypothetical protein